MDRYRATSFDDAAARRWRRRRVVGRVAVSIVATRLLFDDRLRRRRCRYRDLCRASSSSSLSLSVTYFFGIVAVVVVIVVVVVANVIGSLGSSGRECSRRRVGARRLDPLPDPLLVGLRKPHVYN